MMALGEDSVMSKMSRRVVLVKKERRIMATLMGAYEQMVEGIQAQSGISERSVALLFRLTRLDLEDDTKQQQCTQNRALYSAPRLSVGCPHFSCGSTVCRR